VNRELSLLAMCLLLMCALFVSIHINLETQRATLSDCEAK